jgi:hypothetical protein
VQLAFERGAIAADEEGRFRQAFDVAGHSVTVTDASSIAPRG